MIRDKIEQCLPHKDPLELPDYTEAEVQAIRAVHSGNATARQQRMLCDWLIRAAGTHDTSFRPDNSHETAFAEGKRHVGTTFVWMLRSATSRTDADKIASRHIEEDANARPDNR